MKMMRFYDPTMHGSRAAYAALYLAGAVLALPEGMSARSYRLIHPAMCWVYDRLEPLRAGAMVDGYDDVANFFSRRALMAHSVAEAA